MSDRVMQRYYQVIKSPQNGFFEIVLLQKMENKPAQIIRRYGPPTYRFTTERDVRRMLKDLDKLRRRRQ